MTIEQNALKGERDGICWVLVMSQVLEASPACYFTTPQGLHSLSHFEDEKIRVRNYIMFRIHMYLTLNTIFFWLHHIKELPSDK